MFDIILSVIVLMFGIYTIGVSIMVHTKSKFYVKVIPFFGGCLTILYVLIKLNIFTINL